MNKPPPGCAWNLKRALFFTSQTQSSSQEAQHQRLRGVQRRGGRAEGVREVGRSFTDLHKHTEASLV